MDVPYLIETMANLLDNSEFPFLSPVEFPNKAIINVWYSTQNTPTMIQGELHYGTGRSKGLHRLALGFQSFMRARGCGRGSAQDHTTPCWDCARKRHWGIDRVPTTKAACEVLSQQKRSTITLSVTRSRVGRTAPTYL